MKEVASKATSFSFADSAITTPVNVILLDDSGKNST